jgi:hypothetical protein
MHVLLAGWAPRGVLGAERSTAKGSAKAWDHNCLVHSIWTQAFLQKFHIWVERVPTDDNVADLPSRMQYQLLQEIGSVWRQPRIADMYVTGSK